MDPKSPKFEKAVFGDPAAWKIVAVRPRIDRSWTELRVVYQAVKAPEPVFAMFRFRPTWDVPTIPPEARAYNDKVFLDMVQRHLLPDGAPSDKLMGAAKTAVDKLSADTKKDIAEHGLPFPLLADPGLTTVKSYGVATQRGPSVTASRDTFLIDLSGVTFMDSSGVVTLMQAVELLGSKRIVIRSSRQVFTLLEIVGFTDGWLSDVEVLPPAEM